MDGNNTLIIMTDSDTTECVKDCGGDEMYHGNKAGSMRVVCHQALIGKDYAPQEYQRLSQCDGSVGSHVAAQQSSALGFSQSQLLHNGVWGS